jgi:hypothetical protein
MPLRLLKGRVAASKAEYARRAQYVTASKLDTCSSRLTTSTHTGSTKIFASVIIPNHTKAASGPVSSGKCKYPDGTENEERRDEEMGRGR